MEQVQRQLARAAYAQIALEQSLSLAKIAEAATNAALPLANSHSPDWYLAAASPNASLTDVAPELQVIDADHDAPAPAKLDLVRMYAPELDVEEDDEPAAEREMPAPAPDERPTTDDASRMGLLRELSDVDP